MTLPIAFAALAVHFVGNSYTYGEDMPKLAERLVDRFGGGMAISVDAEDSKTLADHGAPARADVLVLQEQSTFGKVDLKPGEAAGSRFAQPMAFFGAVDRYAGKAKRLVLYETWARRDQPRMQAEIASRYRCAAARVGADIAPVGEVWAALAERDSLYAADGSHPSRRGAAVTAYVIAATLSPKVAKAKPEAIARALPELDGLDPAILTRLTTEAQTRMAERPDEPGCKAPDEDFIAGQKAFLVENAKQPGWTTTASGLQYRVLEAAKDANAARPEPGQRLLAHYEGRFTTGVVFDSSYARGEPLAFPPDRVIKGWQEAVSMMRFGDVWELAIPAELAYGPGRGMMPAGATLLFKVELIGPAPGA